MNGAYIKMPTLFLVNKKEKKRPTQTTLSYLRLLVVVLPLTKQQYISSNFSGRMMTWPCDMTSTLGLLYYCHYYHVQVERRQPPGPKQTWQPVLGWGWAEGS